MIAGNVKRFLKLYRAFWPLLAHWFGCTELMFFSSLWKWPKSFNAALILLILNTTIFYKPRSYGFPEILVIKLKQNLLMVSGQIYRLKNHTVIFTSQHRWRFERIATREVKVEKLYLVWDFKRICMEGSYHMLLYCVFHVPDRWVTEVERPPMGMKNHLPGLASRAQPSVGCQGRCSLVTHCVLMIIIRLWKKLDPCSVPWRTSDHLWEIIVG